MLNWLIAASFLLGSSGLASSSDLPARQWSFDLKSAAQVQSARPADIDSSPVLTGYQKVQMLFVADDRLAIGMRFPIRVEGRYPAALEQRNWRALLLIFDTTNQRLLNSYQFEDFRGEGAVDFEIGTVGSGEVLASFGNELVRFSPGLVPLARRTLTHAVEEGAGGHHTHDHWSFMTDARRNTILLKHKTPDGTVENHWIDLGDLADIHVVHPQMPHGDTTTGASLIGTDVVFSSLKHAARDTLFEIQDENGVIRSLGQACQGTLRTSFGDGLLLLSVGHAATHAVFNERCEEIYSRHLGFGADSISSASGAAQANRVAFTYGALRSSLFGSWVSGDHIIVLDTDREREVEVPSKSEKGVRVSDSVQVFDSPVLALSPRGHSLAVANGMSLALWRVP